MRLLAIDPALRKSGFAILEKEGRAIRALAHGVIRNHTELSLSQCLLEIHRQTDQLIAQYLPECCAVESVIFVQNSRTAVTLGAARGSALLAAAQHGLSIFEYPPRRVKQAVVGRGAAQKAQGGFMVRALLGLAETPDPDAADALAFVQHRNVYLQAVGGVPLEVRLPGGGARRLDTGFRAVLGHQAPTRIVQRSRHNGRLLI